MKYFPLVKQLARPDFTLRLNLCHELRAGNGGRSREVVQACATHLGAAVISSADASLDMSLPRTMHRSTVRPLDPAP